MHWMTSEIRLTSPYLNARSWGTPILNPFENPQHNPLSHCSLVAFRDTMGSLPTTAMRKMESICIIGAGPSGLATAK